jgi:hypothetical protein
MRMMLTSLLPVYIVMHAVDDASGLRLVLMMRRYGAGVLQLIQRAIVQSRNACWRPILPAHDLERALARSYTSSTGFSFTRLARLSSLLA